MSFKRDGDDHDLLNRLKHQRVTDLLGNFIPEEEAKLLSNGKFTCLICIYRPIFDTIQMLSVHRKGKKHLLELSKYIKRRSELEFEAMKKEQKESLNLHEDEVSSPRLHVMNAPFLGPKEHITGKYKRKFNENIRRKALELPGFSNEFDSLKTNIENDLHGPSPASQVRNYLKQLPRKLSLEKMVEMKRENYTSKKQQASQGTLVEKIPEGNNKSSRGKVCKEDELSLNLSGWIKDKFGNWVKDPDAEFDSDDDQPPSLPT